MGSDERDTTPAAGLEGLTVAARELAQVMQERGLTSISFKGNGVKLKLRTDGGEVRVVHAQQGDAQASSAAVTSSPSAPAKPAGPVGEALLAPMIGTFYSAAAPGEPPFVQVGDRVEIGQTIGIIEAMKIMNEIAADRAGFVTEINVQNGQGVEFGQELMLLASAPNR